MDFLTQKFTAALTELRRELKEFKASASRIQKSLYKVIARGNKPPKTSHAYKEPEPTTIFVSSAGPTQTRTRFDKQEQIQPLDFLKVALELGTLIAIVGYTIFARIQLQTMDSQLTEIHNQAADTHLMATIQLQQFPPDVDIWELGIHRRGRDGVIAVVDIDNTGKIGIDGKTIRVAANYGFSPPNRSEFNFSYFWDTTLADRNGQQIPSGIIPAGRQNDFYAQVSGSFYGKRIPDNKFSGTFYVWGTVRYADTEKWFCRSASAQEVLKGMHLPGDVGYTENVLPGWSNNCVPK